MDQNKTWHGGKPLPGHIVLDGDPAALPKKREGAQKSPIFGPCIAAKRLDAPIC